MVEEEESDKSRSEVHDDDEDDEDESGEVCIFVQTVYVLVIGKSVYIKKLGLIFVYIFQEDDDDE